MFAFSKQVEAETLKDAKLAPSTILQIWLVSMVTVHLLLYVNEKNQNVHISSIITDIICTQWTLTGSSPMIPISGARRQKPFAHTLQRHLKRLLKSEGRCNSARPQRKPQRRCDLRDFIYLFQETARFVGINRNQIRKMRIIESE